MVSKFPSSILVQNIFLPLSRSFMFFHLTTNLISVSKFFTDNDIFLPGIKLWKRPYFKVTLKMAYTNFLHNLFLHLLHSSLLAQSTHLSLDITWLKFGIPILVILLMLFWKEFLLLVIFLFMSSPKCLLNLSIYKKSHRLPFVLFQLESLTLLTWFIWIYGGLSPWIIPMSKPTNISPIRR